MPHVSDTERCFQFGKMNMYNQLDIAKLFETIGIQSLHLSTAIRFLEGVGKGY